MTTPSAPGGRSRLLLVLQNLSIPFVFDAADREEADVTLVQLPGGPEIPASLADRVSVVRLDIFSDPQGSANMLAAEHLQRPFAGVLTATEAALVFTSDLAERLGLPGLHRVVARRCRNKFQQRAAFRAHGMAVPTFENVTDVDRLEQLISDLEYPVVVKPINGLSSQGVVRADGAEAVRDAWRTVTAINDETLAHYASDQSEAFGILVEGYLDGLEYCVESFVDNGKVEVLAVAYKGDLKGPLFEEGVYITPPALAPEAISLLAAEAERAHVALGVSHGATHTELRFTARGPVVLELNARMGGSGVVHHMVFESTGIDFARLVVRQALGRTTNALPTHSHQAVGANWVMPIGGHGTFDGIDGIETVRSHPDTVEIIELLRPGQPVAAQPRFTGYPAFVLSRHASADDCVAYHRWLGETLITRWREA